MFLGVYISKHSVYKGKTLFIFFVLCLSSCEAGVDLRMSKRGRRRNSRRKSSSSSKRELGLWVERREGVGEVNLVLS